MPQVGIHELKNEASEIIRAVREEQAEYIVTYRGKPVAVIRPVSETSPDTAQRSLLEAGRSLDDFWSKWDALAAEIDDAWTSEKSAVELIEEQRRDL